MSYDLIEIRSQSIATLKVLEELSEEVIAKKDAALSEPTVWIVPSATGETLGKLTRIIENRGIKNPATGLARTMLRDQGRNVPLLAGEYSSTGKLLHGVQTLLKKAAGFPQRLFILAINEPLFAELLKTCNGRSTPVVPLQPAAFSGRSGAVLNLLAPIPEPPHLCRAFIGTSADAVAVRQLILRAGRVDDTVLILGDTGTGKEVIADQIRKNGSRRPEQPFKVINCGAFPGDLLEGELFGHVRGAFTGAVTSNEGIWRAADGGTLFLDEIGELSLNHQAKILRAINEKKIKPVGGIDEIAVNARVICATNRDLWAMVQAGQFREDLFYRLRGFLITTKPLREHPEDIPLLAQAFWSRLSSKRKTLPDDIVKALQNYSWPGNVRELKMLLTSLFSFFQDVETLDLRHLRAVFEHLGLPVESITKGATAADSVRQERMSSYHQLRRTFETIRVIEHLLSPILNPGQALPHDMPPFSAAVGNLLSELEMHNLIPSRFTPRIFENMGLIRAKLTYFLSECEKFPDRAAEHLRSNTREVLNDIMSDILAEIEKSLAKSLAEHS